MNYVVLFSCGWWPVLTSIDIWCHQSAENNLGHHEQDDDCHDDGQGDHHDDCHDQNNNCNDHYDDHHGDCHGDCHDQNDWQIDVTNLQRII